MLVGTKEAVGMDSELRGIDGDVETRRSSEGASDGTFSIAPVGINDCMRAGYKDGCIGGAV
jgi:hypothetical protein